MRAPEDPRISALQDGEYVKKCWRVSPREGDVCVGYAFAATRGKARSVALATDPGSGTLPYSENDFLTYNVVRCPNLDGKAVDGSAWWYPSDVPPESGINPNDLWYDLKEDEE